MPEAPPLFNVNELIEDEKNKFMEGVKNTVSNELVQASNRVVKAEANTAKVKKEYEDLVAEVNQITTYELAQAFYNRPSKNERLR